MGLGYVSPKEANQVWFSVLIDRSLWTSLFGKLLSVCCFLSIRYTYLWRITASQVYRQYPPDLGGSCSFYEVEPCPDSQRVDKPILNHCPGPDPSHLYGVLSCCMQLYACTLKCHKPFSALYAHVLWGRLTYCGPWGVCLCLCDVSVIQNHCKVVYLLAWALARRSSCDRHIAQ